MAPSDSTHQPDVQEPQATGPAAPDPGQPSPPTSLRQPPTPTLPPSTAQPRFISLPPVGGRTWQIEWPDPASATNFLSERPDLQDPYDDGDSIMAILRHPFAAQGPTGPPEAATDKPDLIPFSDLSDGTYLFQGESPEDERALVQSPNFQNWLGTPFQHQNAVRAALDPSSSKSSSSSNGEFNNFPLRVDIEHVTQSALDEMAEQLPWFCYLTKEEMENEPWFSENFGRLAFPPCSPPPSGTTPEKIDDILESGAEWISSHLEAVRLDEERASDPPVEVGPATPEPRKRRRRRRRAKQEKKADTVSRTTHQMKEPAKLPCGHHDQQHCISEYHSSYWSLTSPQERWDRHLKCYPEAERWRKMWQTRPLAIKSSTNAGDKTEKKPPLTSRSSSESSKSDSKILVRSGTARDLPAAARERPVSPRNHEPRSPSPKPTPRPPQPPPARVEDVLTNLSMRPSSSRPSSPSPPPTDQIGGIQMPSHRTVMIDNRVILGRDQIAESANSANSVERIFYLTPEQERANQASFYKAQLAKLGYETRSVRLKPAWSKRK